MMFRPLIVSVALASCTTSAPREPAPVAPGSVPSPFSPLARSEFSTTAAPPEVMLASGGEMDPPASSVAPPPKLAPLTGTAELEPLVIPDYRDAIVSVPVGACESRPVVLALHGNYDRPEWQCRVWREVTKGYPFVVCPRGVPRREAPPPGDRWTYGKPADVRREIDAALAALQIRFGDYVAPGPIVYAGFSLGAILGVGIVADDADRFPRAVLVEGGQRGWSQARAKTYAASGGKRILFACGQRSCKSETKELEKLLGRVGVEAKSVFGGDVGHTYDGPVAEEIAGALPWLIGDDPRWSSP